MTSTRLRDRAELPVPEVADRLPRLRERLDDLGCDLLVVTNLTNIRYLTGFTGSAALLGVTTQDALFVTDGRYREQSADELAAAGVDVGIEVPATAAGQQEVTSAWASHARAVGLEAEDVSWARQRRFAEVWFPDAELVATSGAVEGLRLIKDAGEVARIEAACAIADAALAEVRPQLAEGPTEAEFAAALDDTMRALGADDLSFETIVASGPNGARPHHHPSTRRIEPGDLVVCDFGALVDGYHSDMTRTLWVGEPSPTQRRIFDVVAEAQQAGRAAVCVGVDVAEVDAACRTIIEQAGWGEAFVHSTGHGVGLDIHEDPRVAANVDATLPAGAVVTVEPGVYLPEHGGVRIEDTVVVTADGARRLTASPYDPEV